MTDFQDLEEIVENISFFIENNDQTKLKNIIIDSHPADLADILKALEKDKRIYLFKLIPTETAADVIIMLDEVSRQEIVKYVKPRRLAQIIDNMRSDDAADLISELPDTIARSVLSFIEPQERADVEKLLRHGEETAGGIMELEFLTVYEDQTVDDAIQEVRQRAQEVDQVYYIYAIDRGGRLVGVVPIKKLFLEKPRNLIRDIMKSEVISVPVDMDQEQVANIVSKYDLVAIPVIDKYQRLVGRITIDDIVDVLQDEANEDIQLLAGISDEEIIQETSPLRISRNRLPWLIIAFAGQLLAAFILRQFEVTLAQIAALAFFIPVIMAMGGNAGIQSSTIIIRGMALGDSASTEKWKLFLRELRVALLNGFLLGLMIFLFIWFWLKEPYFGLVVGASMIFVIVNSAVFGALIPFLLGKFDMDPAIATGPFITTTNDVLGLLIYLSLSTAYVAWAGI